MKKIMLAVAALIVATSITLTSCSNAGDKVIGLYKDATEQLKDAKNLKEADEIDKKLSEELKVIYESNKDFKPSESQNKKYGEAVDAYNKAYNEILNKELGI